MSRTIPIETFLERAKEMPVLDVRSPAEYACGHIPCALNLPLFSNEERAEVGTLYKRKGKIHAVQLALERVGPKMRFLTDFVLNLHCTELNLYCWRGGMRSEAMAWLFETVGVACFRLEQGYKSYRNHILERFHEPRTMRLLGGFTGSGKTELLQSLSSIGEQVLDLEALANHKGSAFGGIGQSPQPTTEQFENLIFSKIARMDPSKPLWIEDESRNVGKCTVPEALWGQMRHAPLIEVVMPRPQRVERLMQEYAHFELDYLCIAIKKIEKRLGFDRCKDALTSCLNGDRATALEICLDYYDKAYANQLSERFGKEWEKHLPRFAPHFPLDSIQLNALKTTIE
jgi:tRNA 2-selenouridine synthase